MSVAGPRRRGFIESVGQGINRTRPGGGVEGSTNGMARIAEAIRSQPTTRRARSGSEGGVYVPGGLVFTFSDIDPQNAEFSAGGSGVWEWTANIKASAEGEPIIVAAFAVGDAPESTFSTGPITVEQGINFTILGGSTLSVSVRPGSFFVTTPYTVSVAAWAKRFVNL